MLLLCPHACLSFLKKIQNDTHRLYTPYLRVDYKIHVCTQTAFPTRSLTLRAAINESMCNKLNMFTHMRTELRQEKKHSKV